MTHTLSLKRPLVFFDLETTGTSVMSDRIIEIALLKLLPGGKVKTMTELVNPGMPIPPAATAVHGISDGHVALMPTFGELAPRILDFLDGCDLAGFNVRRFDLPMLRHECERIGMTLDMSDRHVIDTLTIYHMREPRNLAAAVRFYCGHEHGGAHGGAHSALVDVEATLDVFIAQLARYEDLPRDIAELEAVVHAKDPTFVDDDGKVVWRNGEAILNFGKHGGRTLQDLSRHEPDYLRWILNGNFSDSMKTIIRDALENRFPERRD